MRSSGKYLYLLFLLAVAMLLLAPFLGGEMTPFRAPFTPASLEYGIFWKMRVPRVLAAFLAGSVLSLGGMSFQALFRNSLATPYTLGVSGGASLGVALALWLGGTFHFAGAGTNTLAAFFGAALAAALVWFLSHFRHKATTETLLLAGVAASFFFSSLILFLQYIGGQQDLFRMMRWMMGTVSFTGYGDLALFTPLCLAGCLVIFSQREELDLISIGEEFALSRGLDTARTQMILFLAVSLLAGAVVAFCGPIGFVGMICPHIARRLVGASHSILAPASLLLGGTFLLFCDTLARLLIAPSELPVGILTSLLGGPFFLFLLLRRKL